jgi:hypothetical protein
LIAVRVIRSSAHSDAAIDPRSDLVRGYQKTPLSRRDIVRTRALIALERRSKSPISGTIIPVSATLVRSKG